MWEGVFIGLLGIVLAEVVVPAVHREYPWSFVCHPTVYPLPWVGAISAAAIILVVNWAIGPQATGRARVGLDLINAIAGFTTVSTASYLKERRQTLLDEGLVDRIGRRIVAIFHLCLASVKNGAERRSIIERAKDRGYLTQEQYKELADWIHDEDHSDEGGVPPAK